LLKVGVVAKLIAIIVSPSVSTMLLAQGNASEPEYRATRCSGVNEASSATKAMVVSVIAMRKTKARYDDSALCSLGDRGL